MTISVKRHNCEPQIMAEPDGQDDLISGDDSGIPVSAVGDDKGALRAKEASFETVPVLNSYQIKPNLQDKFKANPVKEIIRTVVAQKLAGKTYDSTNAKKWSNSIANDVNMQIKDLRMKRYKHIVQVVIGEMKGAGVKCGVRCLWDSETDGYTSDTYTNESIFCLVVVFAVYLY